MIDSSEDEFDIPLSNDEITSIREKIDDREKECNDEDEV